MPNHRPARRFARTLLALAGLLYLIGMAADPLLHARAGPNDAATAVAYVGGGVPDGSDAPAPDGDRQCQHCTLTGPLLFPSAHQGSAELVVPAAAAVQPTHPGRALAARTPALPRAPPHL
jgi:hypothetical protein